MSLAEEMLSTMSVSDNSASYLAEEEAHIVINDSRLAIVPNELKTIAVTGDKDIETITFDCVRYWDGYDLSTFAIYLNYVLPDDTTGTYIPESIVAEDDVYHFDWKIQNNITKKSGHIAFAITAVKTKQNESGATIVDKQWSSIPNGDCSIALGIDISNVPSEEESSGVLAQMSAILEQIQSNIDSWIASVVVQTTGQSTTNVMSQKASTDSFASKNVNGTVLSENAGYAEILEWADGNTESEYRIGYFVAIDDSTPGKIIKATPEKDVLGVTVSAPSFSGNCSDDKFDANGNLLKQYAFVVFTGVVPVIDNGQCNINDRCIPAEDGTAAQSNNNMGYQVFDRIDLEHILIDVEPGADRLYSIKLDITSLQNNKLDVVNTTSTSHRVYGIHANGTQRIFNANVGLSAGSIVMRGDDKTFEVGTPTKDTHPATKKYVDDANTLSWQAFNVIHYNETAGSIPRAVFERPTGDGLYVIRHLYMNEPEEVTFIQINDVIQEGENRSIKFYNGDFLRQEWINIDTGGMLVQDYNIRIYDSSFNDVTIDRLGDYDTYEYAKIG